MPILHAGRFLQRPFKTEDAPNFVAAVKESGSTVGVWMTWAHANYSEADALDWIATCDSNRSSGLGHEFGIFDRDGTSFLGGAGLNQFNTANAFCSLGYWVRESGQRQGAASAALTALRSHAFETLGLSRVEVVVAASNVLSVALAKKSGATHECLARNRLKIHGKPVAAHVDSFVPQADA